jgi:hypothetical protein
VPDGGVVAAGGVVPLGSVVAPDPIVLSELPIEELLLVVWCFFL